MNHTSTFVNESGLHYYIEEKAITLDANQNPTKITIHTNHKEKGMSLYSFTKYEVEYYQ